MNVINIQSKIAAKMTGKSREQTVKDFFEAVNMDADQLEEWLETDASKKVGFHHEGEGEAVGHQSGRHIVQILRKPEDEYTDADVQHMGKVIAYVHRHLAQRPQRVEGSRWQHSLRNWGHDPAAPEQ